MPQKEDESVKSTRRGKRQKRRSLENKERNSLADAATPVDSKPTQKTTNPEDNIQDSKLPSVQEENIVTAAAASTIQGDKDISATLAVIVTLLQLSGESYILQQRRRKSLKKMLRQS